MNRKNSQIRAHARHLLDDNIFGKDWLKGALTHLLIVLVTISLAGILYNILARMIVRALFIAILERSQVFLFIARFLYTFMVPIILCAIWGPVSVGKAAVYIDLVRGNGNVKIAKFFYGFKNFFSNTLLAIMYVLQVTLWSFFFIVPGIYVAYSYALAFHVKRDHPEYRWKQCFDESERLMEGNRWNLFKLQISHIGWFIMAAAFILIGEFWAIPYLETSTAIFYEEIRNERDFT